MNHIYVVEGTHDIARLKTFNANLNVVSINGSAIDENTLSFLKNADKTHKIILCLDPDHAGERIRSILSQQLNNIGHIFLNKKEAKSSNGKKIGFEHASDDVLKKAFEHIKIEAQTSTSDISLSFLYEQKIIGHIDSAKVRKKICAYFHLGHVNGKKIYERLKAFNITQKEILEVIKDEPSS